MEAAIGTDRTVWTEVGSGVSWASILAGAFVAAALSLALLALGAGLGLASVSPWSGSAVSGATFTNISGAYLLMVAIMSSSIGGYLASRLRTRWTDLHTNEVFFRDSAHGLVAWAFATVLSASVLAAATAHLVGGTVSGVATGVSAAGGQSANPNTVLVDRLFRTENSGASPSGRCWPGVAGYRRCRDVGHSWGGDPRSPYFTDQQRCEGRGCQVVDLELHRWGRLAAGGSNLRRPCNCPANRHERCRCAKTCR